MKDEAIYIFNDGFFVGRRACGFHSGTRFDGHEALIHGAFEDTQAGFEVIVPARDEES